MKFLKYPSLGLYVGLTSFTVSAQEPITSPESTPAIDVTNVTALRIESESHQLPINKVDAAQYQQASHISEALAQSPSVWVSRGNGQENLTAIRSPVYVGAGACGPFIMSEDGVSLRAPNFCNVNQLFDANYIQADGIEVLRGPGSEAYGSNAIHGIINVISPQFNAKPTTTITITDNSHGFNRYSADYRSHHFIAQAMHDDNKGYKDDSGYTQSKLRLKHLAQFNAEWSAVQNFNYMKLNQDTAGYSVGEDAYKDDSRKKENAKSGFRKAESYRYAASFTFKPRENAVLQITPYLRSNDMEFSMHWLDPAITEQNGHNSAGLLSIFSRTYGAWQVNTGFDFDYTDAYLTQTNAGPPIFGGKISTGKHYNFDVNAVSSAIFLNANYQLSQSWSYMAGVRFDYLRFDYINHLSNGAACDSSIAVEDCRFYRPDNTTDSFKEWSPRTSLTWKFSQNQFASVNVSQTFRAPQATELYRLEQGQKNSQIDSVRANNAELVFSGRLLSLNYNLSAYYMKKKNVIIKNNDKINVDGQKTRHQGIEFSLEGWLINSNLELIASYAYGKHQYDSNPYLLFASGKNIKGNIMDTAPRHLGSAKLNWHVVNSSVLGLEAVYLDNYYLNPDNTKQYKGHTLTNIYFNQLLPWNIEVSATVKNVFDIDYADRADIQPFSGNTPRYFIGEPRSYQLSIAKTF